MIYVLTTNEGDFLVLEQPTEADCRKYVTKKLKEGRSLSSVVFTYRPCVVLKDCKHLVC